MLGLDPKLARRAAYLAMRLLWLPGDRPKRMYRRVEHDPQEGNYSHTELRVYKDGKRVTLAEKNQISKQDRTEYRLEIMKSALVIYEPLI